MSRRIGRESLHTLGALGEPPFVEVEGKGIIRIIKIMTNLVRNDKPIMQAVRGFSPSGDACSVIFWVMPCFYDSCVGCCSSMCSFKM